MRRAQVQVPWEAGLHLRPATRLVRIAQTFHSRILLKCGDRLADARSIAGILLLAASMGTVVEVEASGEDEAMAAGAIEHAFSMDDEGRTSPPTHGLSGRRREFANGTNANSRN